jgi:hypothetical protein
MDKQPPSRLNSALARLAKEAIDRIDVEELISSATDEISRRREQAKREAEPVKEKVTGTGSSRSLYETLDHLVATGAKIIAVEDPEPAGEPKLKRKYQPKVEEPEESEETGVPTVAVAAAAAVAVVTFAALRALTRR